MPEEPGAVRKEEEMREHEQEARERSRTSATTRRPARHWGGRSARHPDEDAMPAPPGNVQGANLGGAS